MNIKYINKNKAKFVKTDDGKEFEVTDVVYANALPSKGTSKTLYIINDETYYHNGNQFLQLKLEVKSDTKKVAEKELKEVKEDIL